MKIGDRIKEARLRAGLTQEELAKMVGVTKGSIANYETGVSVPKVECLYPLMAALGVDANYVYGVTPDDGSMRVSPREKQLVIAYRSHPDMQDAVDRLLQLPAEAEAKHKNA